MQTLTTRESEIEHKKTKVRVEEMLHACRLYMQIGYHPGREARVTASYSLSPASGTNAVHSSTESVAQRNVDEEQRRRQLVERVLEAVERLSEVESLLIRKRYLEDDDALDYIIWNELNLSERKYYRMKKKAFFKLALLLHLVVYTQQPGESE